MLNKQINNRSECITVENTYYVKETCRAKLKETKKRYNSYGDLLIQKNNYLYLLVLSTSF